MRRSMLPHLPGNFPSTELSDHLPVGCLHDVESIVATGGLGERATLLAGVCKPTEDDTSSGINNNQ